MENPPEKSESPKQICTIRIAFPVESDEQAIVIKKKIEGSLAEIPDAAIQFSLMPARAASMMPQRG